MKTAIQNNGDVKIKQGITSTKVQDDKAGKKAVTETIVTPSAKDMKDSLPTKK